MACQFQKICIYLCSDINMYIMYKAPPVKPLRALNTILIMALEIFFHKP